MALFFVRTLKAAWKGACAALPTSLIKNMEGFTVKLCMSQRHEACSVYMQSLHNMIEYGSYSHFIVADLR